MHLDEFSVGVVRALLIERRLRRSGADDRVGGLAEDGAITAGRYNHRFCREGVYRHAAQIHGADTATDTLVVDDAGEELPRFVLRDFAFGFVAAHLLVERVEQLLASSGPRKGSAVVERAAEAPEVEQSLWSAVEGNTHAVEQVNDAGRHVAHGLCWRLAGEEVAAIDGVVEVLPGGVAFALQVLRGIDAALRADRVRPLDRNDGEKVNVTSHLGNFDGGRKPCQSATHNDDLRICHIKSYVQRRTLPKPLRRKT